MTLKIWVGGVVAGLMLWTLAGCGESEDDATEPAVEEVGFMLSFTNLTAAGDLTPPGGEAQDIAFAPGVWAVYTDTGRLFGSGEEVTGKGLEDLAEEGRARPMLSEIEGDASLYASGPFATLNADDYSEDPIGPGETVTIRVRATPGGRLWFASMYIQSNDLFIGTPEVGIALFDAQGQPMRGDVSDQVLLWDAGTEVNEESGLGANQAPRQGDAGAGEAEDGQVRAIEGGVDSAGFGYPLMRDVLRVTLEPE